MVEEGYKTALFFVDRVHQCVSNQAGEAADGAVVKRANLHWAKQIDYDLAQAKVQYELRESICSARSVV